MSSADAQTLATIYGFINNSRDGDPKKTHYMTLNLPQHAAIVVNDIERISVIKLALPEEIRGMIDDIKSGWDKALVSTTSINSKVLEMLTTAKQKIEVNNPQARQGILANLLKPKPHDQM